MDYIIKLESFEGPFELLLELIKKREMDIYDLKISQITKDYLTSIEQMKEQDIEITSDFMEMAAMLLEIKAKMLLPVEVEKDDPRNELINQILNYKEYKESIDKLRELKDIEQRFFKRQKSEKIKRKKKGTLEDIIKSYQNVLSKKDKQNNKSRMDDLTKELSRFKYTMEDRLEHLKNLLEEQPITVEVFFTNMNDREEMIVTFSALLELVKIQYVSVIFENNILCIERKGA